MGLDRYFPAERDEDLGTLLKNHLKNWNERVNWEGNCIFLLKRIAIWEKTIFSATPWWRRWRVYFGFDTVVISGANEPIKQLWHTSPLFHGTLYYVDGPLGYCGGSPSLGHSF